MAITLVQKTTPVVTGAGSGTGQSVSSGSVTFGSTTTTGNLIVVIVNYATAAGLTVSDNKGNGNYSLATSVVSSANSGTSSIYYKANAAGGASHQITASWGATNTYFHVAAAEVSGIVTSSPLDKTATSATDIASSGTSAAITSPTLTQANEIVFATVLPVGTFDSTANPGAPWSAWYARLDWGTDFDSAAVSQIVAATTAVTATWTFSAPGSTSECTRALATFLGATASTSLLLPRKPLRFFRRSY